MAVVQISDVIVPVNFTDYVVQNTMESTALLDSGVASRNGAIDDHLQAGSNSFTVPFWLDIANDEADIVSDDPTEFSKPHKIGSGKQNVRKSFLHNSWSAMNLASELAGSNALKRIEDRVAAYWSRQMQRRLISTLKGVLADNVANDAGDMVVDISAAAGDAAKFNASAVIDTAGTLGDAMRDLVAIGMHSDTYKAALKNNLIETVPQSSGGFIQTFRGLGIIMDDSLPVTTGVYTTVLFGRGAVGFGSSAPRVAAGTSVETIESAGNGGGQEILHSRLNVSIHPAGFSWKEATVAAESPTIAELALPANWDRIIERKAIQLAFLKHKL